MWSKLLAFGASAIQIGNLLLKTQDSIEEMQKQINETDSNMRLMAEKLQHFTEMERANHRNNLLELENRLLKMEKQLPPADKEKEAE